MKRAVIIIIDGLGAGAMPDCSRYFDSADCNTLLNVIEKTAVSLPVLQKLGLGNILPLKSVLPAENPLALYGIMEELSAGKDTTTGHWEIAGLVLEEAFKTYPDGFPKELISEFVKRTECGNILCNKPASGTAVINEFGDEHIETGFPIVYTSADSVFQIACHTDKIPLEKLYGWCEIARKILDENTSTHNVCRVIARPFAGNSGNYFRLSAERRDYSVPPHKPTILNKIEELGGEVIAIGKIEDIFVKSGITQAVHTGSNKEGLELTLKALQNNLKEEKGLHVYKKVINSSFSLIFVNLVDTDMLFGHRNDFSGFGNALVEIDFYLGKLLKFIGEDDILIITADHGCDPTVKGTDHTREKVPLLVYNPLISGKNIGTRKSFSDVAVSVAEWFNIKFDCQNGINFL